MCLLMRQRDTKSNVSQCQGSDGDLPEDSNNPLYSRVQTKPDHLQLHLPFLTLTNFVASSANV